MGAVDVGELFPTLRDDDAEVGELQLAGSINQHVTRPGQLVTAAWVGARRAKFVDLGDTDRRCPQLLADLGPETDQTCRAIAPGSLAG